MSKARFSLADLGVPGAIPPPGAEAITITGLALDSRKVRPGDLFAALPGVKTDGRAFIAQAEAAGAAAILAPPDTATEIPLLAAEDPREALARIAARFYPRQPEVIAAVTGTNGKSSTVEFLRQIWVRAGFDAASLGTLGAVRGEARADVGYTTPDAIGLHQTLDRLAGLGVTHLAMEASSHGLKQRRMDEARIAVSAFTNLTQDHMDYHPTYADYFASKARLFDALTPPGAPAVINVDDAPGEEMAAIAERQGLQVRRIGWRGEDLQILEITPHPASQDIRLVHGGQERVIALPLVGEFQAANAIGAAALAIETGVGAIDAFGSLESLTGAPGRLEKVAETPNGAPIFVDYAHTPDGLDKLLRAARPHTQGRIILVFGAGGDRDPTKRVKMGAVAAKLADVIIVTDDNPRSEEPDLIRRAVLEGCPGAAEIADRSAAIQVGAKALKPGDTLLIAGKGHETGQIIGDTVRPFDDRQEARKAAEALTR